jgi:hypothetical protein
VIVQFLDYSGDVYTHEGGNWFKHVLDPDLERRFPIPISKVCVGSVHPFADGLDLDRLMEDGEMDLGSKAMKGFEGSKAMKGFEPRLKMGFLPVFVEEERVFYGSPIIEVVFQMRY